MFDNFRMLALGDDDVEYLPILSVDDEAAHKKITFDNVLPILPLRNTVLFPGVVLPITVGRDKSIKAVNAAYRHDKILGVVSQKAVDVEEPLPEDLNTIGTAARIVKRMKMPDGSTTVILQGVRKIQVKEFIDEGPYLRGTIDELAEDRMEGNIEMDALISTLRDLATNIVRMSPNIPSEAAIVVKNIESSEFLVHFIASNLNITLKEKQQILEVPGILERAKLVLQFLAKEHEMLDLKDKIQTKVRSDIEKQQRDYFLSQQLKTIQEELGHGDALEKELERLRSKAATKKWDAKVAKAFNRELEKLQRINPAAAEYSVILNYLDTLLDLPWNDVTKDNFDLGRAQKVLDQDHYGLEKIKERILEYLAVLKLKGDMKSPILCFVGPPGVGKTSLGRSIARALNRKYVRMSLGGLHDEAEIRGHRKTYIGAMPGRIVQNLKKVHSSNPVFILDEIDKVGSDFRGDPSSALLEVLDPEQNSAFYDNYLELEYDLSKVLFIATANSLNTIQPALRDRMEIILVDGYSVEEKVQIGKNYLVPKQRQLHGLKAVDLRISEKTLEVLVMDYTRESGVRELDRQLASVMRSIAKRLASGETYSKTVSISDLENYLGPVKYDRNEYLEQNPSGVSIGLAYTSFGGEILYIECSLNRGKGKLTLTGNLGEVMKESAITALSFLKAHTEEFGIDQQLFEEWDVHLHVPEGATPKDGPSAGVSILTALTSAFTQRKVKPYTAMTGEITLRGKVLPVGGIKEKILAAKRAGMKTVLLPEKNRKDVEQVNQAYIKGLEVRYVKEMLDVLKMALKSEKDQQAKALTVVSERKTGT